MVYIDLRTNHSSN